MREGRSVSSRSRQTARGAEEGSALLIVLVLAAMVAIALYMEIPDVFFEAQRQKEQMAIDRGGEYVNAIKLFRRKVGRFPNSIKELEDTNRMRFIRHAYTDPLTGKADWRLIHMGPGGQLIDSKVNPGGIPGMPTLNAGANGQAGGVPTSTAAFPANNNSFNSTNSNNNDQSSSTDANANTPGQNAQPDLAALRRSLRPPPVSAGGSGDQTASGSGANAPGADSSNTPPPSAPPAAGDLSTNANQSAANGGAPGPGNGSGTPNSSNNGSAPSVTDAKSQMVNGGSGLSGGPSSSFNGNGQTGVINGGGGIGGVASIANGHSIKLVNDQSSYARWEFYYDPRNDPAMMSGMQIGLTGPPAGTTVPGQTGAPGFNTGQSNGTSSFGAGQTSSFGSQSPSSFGANSNSNTNTGAQNSTDPNTGLSSPNQPASPTNAQPQ